MAGVAAPPAQQRTHLPHYSALATAAEAEATWSEEKSTATDSAAIFDPLLGDSTTILPRSVCVCKPAATVVPSSARCFAKLLSTELSFCLASEG